MSAEIDAAELSVSSKIAEAVCIARAVSCVCTGEYPAAVIHTAAAIKAFIIIMFLFVLIADCLTLFCSPFDVFIITAETKLNLNPM